MAEILPQFAPCGQHARTVEIAERDRPDDALGSLARLIAILDRDPAFGPDRLAQDCEVDRLFLSAPALAFTDDHQRIGVERVTQVPRQDSGDFRQRRSGGMAQLMIRTFRHPARPKHQRLDLLLGEHQRRQHEAGTQHVAKPRLALYVRALRL